MYYSCIYLSIFFAFIDISTIFYCWCCNYSWRFCHSLSLLFCWDDNVTVIFFIIIIIIKLISWLVKAFFFNFKLLSYCLSTTTLMSLLFTKIHRLQVIRHDNLCRCCSSLFLSTCVYIVYNYNRASEGYFSLLLLQ